MSPHARYPVEAEPVSHEITPTQLFAVFADERRQHALAYLAHRPAAIHLGDLAEYIAIKEDEPTYEWYERICVDLHHTHLSQMSDLGLVHYDAERELVDLAVDRELVAPYLELAHRVDA